MRSSPQESRFNLKYKAACVPQSGGANEIGPPEVDLLALPHWGGFPVVWHSHHHRGNTWNMGRELSESIFEGVLFMERTCERQEVRQDGQSSECFTGVGQAISKEIIILTVFGDWPDNDHFVPQSRMVGTDVSQQVHGAKP